MEILTSKHSKQMRLTFVVRFVSVTYLISLFVFAGEDEGHSEENMEEYRREQKRLLQEIEEVCAIPVCVYVNNWITCHKISNIFFIIITARR
jgi:hypothetical protein